MGLSCALSEPPECPARAGHQVIQPRDDANRAERVNIGNTICTLIQAEAEIEGTSLLIGFMSPKRESWRRSPGR